MRRLAFVAFAFILPVPVTLLGYGCGAKAPTIEDYCGFLKNPDNCYSTLIKDMGARCGAPSGSDKDTDLPETWAPSGTVQGYFLKRDKLDICVLNEGGSIVFEESLDLASFPLSSVSFTMMDNAGAMCGAFAFTSAYSFAIDVAPADSNGKVLPTGGATCEKFDGGVVEDSPDATDDPGGTSVTCGGNFVATSPEGKFIDTTCGKEEHHFISSQLELEACAAQKNLLPKYQLDTSPGGVAMAGHVRLRVLYPLLDRSPPFAGATSFPVTYFDCLIPAAVKECCNGVLDGSETDKDCGGPTAVQAGGAACNRCKEGQQCNNDSDCLDDATCVGDMTGITKCKGPDGGSTPEATNVCAPPDMGTGGAGGAGGTGGTGGADAGGI